MKRRQQHELVTAADDSMPRTKRERALYENKMIADAVKVELPKILDKVMPVWTKRGYSVERIEAETQKVKHKLQLGLIDYLKRSKIEFMREIAKKASATAGCGPSEDTSEKKPVSSVDLSSMPPPPVPPGKRMKTCIPEAEASKSSTNGSPSTGVETTQSGAGAGVSGGARPDSKVLGDWAWVIDEIACPGARLPELGLPVVWESETEDAHQMIVFNPSTRKKISVDASKFIWRASNAIGFLKSTALTTPLPGAIAPDTARYSLFSDPRFEVARVKSATGDILVPCFVHGDYVSVQSMQSDYAEPKAKIVSRQKELIAQLNSDKEFSRTVLALDGADKFFRTVGEKIYGTLFFYEFYFNDIDNLWLICGACNNHKSGKDIEGWFREQPLYGEEFLSFVGGIAQRGIVCKTGRGEGVAEAAINWFWTRHSRFAKSAKHFQERAAVPLGKISTLTPT